MSIEHVRSVRLKRTKRDVVAGCVTGYLLSVGQSGRPLGLGPRHIAGSNPVTQNVNVAQLVEHWLVRPGVTGSSPAIHPFGG